MLLFSMFFFFCFSPTFISPSEHAVPHSIAYKLAVKGNPQYENCLNSVHDSIFVSIALAWNRCPAALVHLVRRAHCVHNSGLGLTYPIPVETTKILNSIEINLPPENKTVLIHTYHHLKLTNPKDVFNSGIELRNLSKLVNHI